MLNKVSGPGNMLHFMYTSAVFDCYVSVHESEFAKGMIKNYDQGGPGSKSQRYRTL